MLLQLKNSNTQQVQVLLDFAKKNQLDLKIPDEGGDELFLPGKPMNAVTLEQPVKKSRKSGHLNMEEAHLLIRSNFNESYIQMMHTKF